MPRVRQRVLPELRPEETFAETPRRSARAAAAAAATAARVIGADRLDLRARAGRNNDTAAAATTARSRPFPEPGSARNPTASVRLATVNVPRRSQAVSIRKLLLSLYRNGRW